ncbi:integrase catalytic domain-containing protein [Trichonephila clavipes]|nr:integrase catalytic domain-containing protein [Trichonephila clavipes]
MELHKWGSSHPELASNILGDYEFENPIETKTTIRSSSGKSQDLHAVSLWSLKIDWIDELPSERAKEWHRFRGLQQSWIQKEPNLLKTFVANRVATIQHLTNAEQWHHVSSEQNPADLVSRGLDPSSLLNNSLWWNGPKFLTTKDFPEKNTLSSVTDNDEFNCEFKSNAKHCVNLNLTNSTFMTDLLNISNKYTKIIRMLSFIFRFIANCRGEKRRGPLDVQEINQAEVTLIKIVQLQEFKKYIMSLKENNRVSAESLIKSLNPFLDKDGVLRVGGRLCNSDLNFECKFPVILPCNHKLTNLIVEYFYLKYFHLGPQALLYQVRQRFWPLRGRNVCRKIVHDCLVCFKVKPITCEQIMGNLPKERVRKNFPFDCSGIDFIGPFWIKSNKQRKSSLYKIYVSIFVCFVTKAVHFELVSDLTTQTFIASLKRFIARRGRPSLIFSDNGKTFIGANAELKRLYKLVINPDPELAGFLVDENIN